MFGNRRRLMRDVERWRSLGWVTNEGEAGILAELARGGGMPLAPILAILASVLFGFAAISFVAAHWDQMPRLGRLGLLFGTLWAGYGAAGMFQSRGQAHFADAAILFAVAMFGCSIMLISQMFHIDGSPPDGVLMWWIGALLAGVALRSNPALAFAMVLVGVWGFMEMQQRDAVYWPFLIGWSAVSAAFAWQHWRPGVHLSGLALALFVFSIGLFRHLSNADIIVTVAGLLGCAAAIAGERVRPDWHGIWPAVLGYSAVTAFAGLMLLQFYKTPEQSMFIVLAALTLTLLLALIWWGMVSHNKSAAWLGYAGFSIEILAVYAEKIGTLLGTSMFFLSAGLIVAALAFTAVRLNARGRAIGEVRS
jgi:uncharacterized membrane protein